MLLAVCYGAPAGPAAQTSLSLEASGIGLDGTGHAYCGASGSSSPTSCNATFATSNASSVVIAFCSVSNNTATDVVTDSARHAWTLRGDARVISPEVYEYYTTSTSMIKNDTVTCSTNHDLNVDLIVFGASGVNLTSPFDSNSTLPAYNYSRTGGTPSATVKLSDASDMLWELVAVAETGCAYPSLGSGLSLIALSGSPPCNEGEYELTHAAGAHTVSYGSSTGSHPYILIADAIRAV